MSYNNTPGKLFLILTEHMYLARCKFCKTSVPKSSGIALFVCYRVGDWVLSFISNCDYNGNLSEELPRNFEVATWKY